MVSFRAIPRAGFRRVSLFLCVIVVIFGARYTFAATEAKLSVRSNTVRALALAYADWEKQLELRKEAHGDDGVSDIDQFVFRLQFVGDRFRVGVFVANPSSQWRALEPVYFIDRSGNEIIGRVYR